MRRILISNLASQIQIYLHDFFPQNAIYLLVHNRDQIYIPKMDDIYGSELIFLSLSQEMRKAGTMGLQPYKMKRTLVKGLDTPTKRCDKDGSVARIAQCITSYLEIMTGCSMGLLRSDVQAPR